MKIIIIGGGIDELTTALSLHKDGFEFNVFEPIKVIKPLGVGINILQHSVRILTNLDLQEKIAQNAIETSDFAYFYKFGQQFWTEKRVRFAGYKRGEFFSPA
jgi:2-polyprenyl-6-methoxyphenol hydroxylase-like FAD-dependent oxidoreductase